MKMVSIGRATVALAWGALLLMGMMLGSAARAQSVTDGLALYASKGCNGCHGSPAAASEDHRFGSNAPQRILAAINGAFDVTHIVNGIAYTPIGGQMNTLTLHALTAQERLSLALFIGQQKFPTFTVGNGAPELRINVRAGASGTKNIYPVLLADGGVTDATFSSGGAAKDAADGLIATTPSNGSSSTAQSGAGATMNYNVSYTSTSPFLTGTDSFNITVASARGSNAGSTRQIAVTVFGISNLVNTVQGTKGQAYGVGSALYTVTCNGCVAGSFSVDPASLNQLPTGLSLNPGTGAITGTPSATGVFNVKLRAISSGAADSGDGPVNKDITITIIGITSPATANYTQNVGPVTPYQITSFPTPPSAFALTGTLPAGLIFVAGSGQIAGTPTLFGTFPVTIQATTNLGLVSQALNVVVASAGSPVITTTPTLAVPPIAAGTVGVAFSAQINASNPPIDANSYTATGLPAGVSVNAASGLISGVPPPGSSGPYTLVLGATNSAGAGVGTLSVNIIINPADAPVVTSTPALAAAPAATGTVGTAITPIQINATNPPLNPSGYAAIGLPDGLTVNANSGQISGTPTKSGDFDVVLQATNSRGTGSSASIKIRINSDTVPSVTSPTFATLAAGVPIIPIQIVATNPVILSYSAVNLPAGLNLDPATGVISGTPTAPGSKAATLTATNAKGPGSRSVQFTVSVPAPTACAMSVPLNTPTTLNLASCLFNGSAPSGVSIIATAAHGTAVVNGTTVTYTPVHNYFGADSFSFVGYYGVSSSPVASSQGVVTVTVTGRPDPTQDVAVTALIAAQTETAQRFSRAQMSNFQRRMESLHGGAGDTGQTDSSLMGASAAGVGRPAGFGASAALSTPVQVASVSGTVTAAMAALAGTRNIGSGAGAQGTNGSVFGPPAIPAATRESDVLDAIAGGLGLKSLPFADSVFSMIKSRSVNLAGVASGLGLNTSASKTGNTSYWVEGVASFGTRDASGGFSGSEFNSSGVSVGADRRFSDEWVLGMGLGYARDTTKIGTDGSSNRSRGYSLAVYGSYQPSPNTFVDGVLGVGTLDFDTTRYVAPINDFALGQRSGNQVFGSLTGGYEFRDKALLVSPYARVDFSSSRLRDSTESGAGAYALTYFGQTANSVQGALGIRGESVHATDFGYAVPRVRAEYLHEFRGTGQAFIGYADQIGGPRYALASAGTGRNAIVLGIGSDFLMRDGLTLAFEYQLSRSSAHDSSYALRLRLTKEFDAQGLPKLLGEYPVRIGKPLDIQLDVGYTYDDNVTRAKSGPDKLSDDSYSINVSKTIISPLSEQSRLLLTGTLGGEKFHHFNGLSRVLGSAEAEVQYRESSDFDAPTFATFAKLTGEEYETRLRDGYRLSAGVSIRQALTDRINVFGALSRNVRNASSSVFSTRDSSARINFDYALSDRQTLYLSGEYRRGDIVSTGHASLENVSIAKVFAQDDGYAGGQLFSYRFDGSTVLATLGFNLAVGAKDSIDFSWRYVRSTPGLRPSFVTSPRNYITNQLSAVYLMRF